MTARRETLTASRKKKAKKLLNKQQFAEARQLYAEICRIDPNDYESWLLLADLSARLNSPADAETAYKQAAILRPQEDKPLLGLGLLYKAHGRFNEAETWLWRACQLQRAALAEYKRLGTDLQQHGQLGLAIRIYRNLLQLTPDDADTCNNLGVALQNLGQLDEALEALQRALEVAPPKAHIYCNMANIHVDKRNYEQAYHCYQEALKLDPDSINTLGSLGSFYMGQMQLEKALECFDKAIAINPGFAGAYWNRSMIHLMQGNFSEGWREYDARFNSPDVVQRYGRREFSIPMWEGQPIPGKTLLVYAEQGFGDSIQFCRYLPLVQQRVDHLVFESRPELLRLMQTLPGNIECVARRDDFGMPAIHFDYHIPLMSLPRIFDTQLETIPAEIPYLHADEDLAQQWSQHIQNDDFKVGLVWAGSPTHRRDLERSLNLEQLAPLTQLQGVTFYSLQMGPAAQQIANAPAGMKIIDLGKEIIDFADTAAIIANLDLVISVDTAVAHLAGALGKPVWVLLYYPAEWRWLLDRDDSPWYPTMRLFRQGSDRDWSMVIQRLISALKEKADAPGKA
jgi:Flp pilus assembly protein TadD